MILIKPNTTNTNNPTDKLIVVGVFFISCIFGISIAIYPNWWRKNKQKTNQKINLKKPKTSRLYKGHHPDCNIFKNHIILIKNKPRCTGCLGLIIGAISSFLLITIYLISPIKISKTYFFIFITIGIIVLFSIYIEILFLKRNTSIHIILNSLLIISFLTITIGVFEITKNLIYSISTILLCFLWLNTRIIFSKQKHKRTCQSCKQECKSY